MAIVNRDLDPSQQKDVIYWNSQGAYGATFTQSTIGPGGLPVGVTVILTGPIPFPYVLQSVNALNMGASGSPALSWNIMRVVGGGGVTMVAVSISNMIIPNGASFMTAFGYSGTLYGGYSGLAATGSTLLQGLAGDLISCTTTGANTASTLLTVSLVLKKVQDTVTMVSNSG